MEQHTLSTALFITTFVLGLRHGIDWDHIAAITDITGSAENTKKSFFLATMYVLGHATVIIVLGLLAVVFNLQLPSWVDALMEPLVGITLVILGVWLLVNILLHGKNYELKSRWMLIFSTVAKITRFIKAKTTHSHPHGHGHTHVHSHLQNISTKTAYIIGAIHGIGAETPTQILLFIAAAGVGGRFAGAMILLTFVAGLVISNSLITLAALFGYAHSHRHSVIYMIIGVATALFSLITGLIFLFGHGGILPEIIRTGS